MDRDEMLETIIAFLIVGGIVLAVVGLAQGWWSTTGEEEPVYDVPVDDDPMLGPDDAPVTVIEFSDFSCTHCASFANDAGELLREYAENGTVRFVFRDFPLTSIHPHALQVAEAAGCAYEQEKFWEYHDLVYRNLSAQEVGHLREYAEEAGLNVTEYEECFSSERRVREVQGDLQDGREYGVRGTPTFFINGQRYTGVLTRDELRAAIAEAR